MVFTVWLNEFCVNHAKFQVIYVLLESHNLLDTLQIIRKLITRKREQRENCEIEDLTEKWYVGNNLHSIRKYKNSSKTSFKETCFDESGQIRTLCDWNGRLHNRSKGFIENGVFNYDLEFKNHLIIFRNSDEEITHIKNGRTQQEVRMIPY